MGQHSRIFGHSLQVQQSHRHAFWRHCWEHTNLASAAEVAEYYQELGPDGYWGNVGLNTSHDQFAIGGYITLMVGMKVPYRKTFQLTEKNIADFDRYRAIFHNVAEKSMTVNEALVAVRSPGWQWSWKS